MKLGGKRRVVILILVAMVAATISYHFAVNRGPTYQGHTVSYWFETYCRACEWRTSDAERLYNSQEALVKLGTNAVPYLLEQAFDTNQDSAARTNLIRFINSLPRSWPISAPISRDTLRNTAPIFLYRIRPPADRVLPVLEREFRATNSPCNFARRQALIIMGDVGDDAEREVPLLVEALNDPDLTAQRIALQSLFQIGSKAEMAVPAMQAKFIGETNSFRRLWIASGLFRIEKRPEELKFLTDSLQTNHPTPDRQNAAQLIFEIGPDALAAAPALIAILPADDPNLNMYSIDALRKMGVPTGDYVGRLKVRLKSDDPQERVRVARMVIMAVPTDPDALRILAEAGNAKRAQGQGASPGAGTNGTVR